MGDCEMVVEQILACPELNSAWQEVLDDEVLDLLRDFPESLVGQDCIKVMLAADAFISLLTDVAEPDLIEVRSTAAQQCAVFFYG